MKIRAVIKWFWVHFLFLSGLLWWAKWRLRRQGAIVVLLFHRVLGDDDFEKTNAAPGMVVRQRTFKQLVRYLVDRCQPVNLAAGELGWNAEYRKLRVAITFDDGWIDNSTTAFPIAQTYRLPLTIFVCPGLMGRRSPFWPERVVALWRATESVPGGSRKIEAWMASSANLQALSSQSRDSTETLEWVIESLKTYPPAERERLISELAKCAAADPRAAELEPSDATLTWKDFERMGRAGVTFGSHTQTHQILLQIPRDLARTELVDSQREIQQRLRRKCVLFAYPNGDWSPDIRDLVSQAGYKLAFTTQLGGWKRDCDSLLIPRVTVSEGMVVGPLGRFSRAAFEYGAFWKVYRAKGSAAQDKGLIASSSAQDEDSIPGRRNQIAAGVL